MEKEKSKRRKSQGGRKPVKDPAIHFYGFKLNSKEKLAFDMLLDKSGMDNVSRFIKKVIFGKEIKVIKIDRATMDYYIRLTEFYRQFQAIGNNYNQTVKAVRTNFGEKRGLQMLARLEKATVQLIIISKQVIELTREYEQNYLIRKE